MFRGFVLRFLGNIARGMSPDEAAAALPSVISAIIPRLARKHLVSAAFETEAADDTAHLHRVAYLRAAGTPAINPNDKDAVGRDFAQASQRGFETNAGRRFVVGSGLLLSLVACIALAIVFVPDLLASPAAPTDATSNEAPADASLDASGTREATASERHALHLLFSSLLPNFVVALDATGAGRPRPPPMDVRTTRGEVLREVAQQQPELLEPITNVLDTAVNVVLESGDESIEESDDRWIRNLILFHDRLRDLEIPFYADALLTKNWRTGRRRVLISTFDVEWSRHFNVAERQIHALGLTRLDNLNFEGTRLGYTRPEIRYALVVNNKLERFLLRNVLPSIHSANHSALVRDYHREADTQWVTDFEQWAHEDLAADVQALLTAKSGTLRGLRELAEAASERKLAIRAISGSMPRGRLREPERYEYDPPPAVELSPQVDRRALQRLRRSQAILEQPHVRGAWNTIQDGFAESIARHEVQHRLDYEDDRLVQVPEVLAAYVGTTESEDRVNRRAERTNAELSAYLSQIVQTPELSRTSMIHILSFCMSRRSWPMVECRAAIALFEALAAQAEFPHAPLITGRRVNRSALASIYGELRAKEPDALRTLVSTTWERLYQAELVKIP